jgi:hypothetical protein
MIRACLFHSIVGTGRYITRVQPTRIINAPSIRTLATPRPQWCRHRPSTRNPPPPSLSPCHPHETPTWECPRHRQTCLWKTRKQKGSKREAKGSGASRANPRGTRILDGVCVQDLEAKTLPISLNAALAARVLLTCEGAKPREMSILDCVKYLSLRRYREGLP